MHGSGLSVGGYAAGTALLVAIIGSAVFAGRRVRARLLPGETGATTRLAEAVLAIALVLAVELGLGAAGLFRRSAVATVCVGVALFVGVVAGRHPHRGEAGVSHPPRLPRALVGVASAAAVVVVAQWSTHVFFSGHYGILDVDSLDYHLTFAARFTQTGWITRLNFVDPETATAFHPANAELLHGLGMVLFGRELLSVVLNMGWLGLTLLAGWCVGRPYGRAPATLVATAVLLAPPLLVATQAGTAQNDIVAGFFLLACVALLLTADGRPGPAAVAGLAGGLAVGTKLTALVPVGVLTIGVVVLALRGRHRRTALAWLVPLLVIGSFWYVRNLVHIGNPVPALHVALGGLSLPRPHIDKIDHFGYAVSHYLPQGRVLRTIFVPVLRRAFGVAWPATLLLAAAGLVLSAFQARAPVRRLAGIAGLAAAAAYIVTPTSAGGPPGTPVFLEANLRYLWPALLLGLVLLPTCEALSTRRRAPWVFASLAALLVATELSRGAWPDRYRGQAAAVGVAAVGCVAIVAVMRRLCPPPPLRAGIALGGVAAVAALGYPAQHAFARHRYRDTGERLAPAYVWATGVRSAPIAITGMFTQFPLYGPDLSNRVTYVGHRGAHGAFSVIGTCREWRTAISKGRYSYVVTAPGIAADPVPLAAAWTKSDRAARQIVDTGTISVFALGGALHAEACGA